MVDHVTGFEVCGGHENRSRKISSLGLLSGSRHRLAVASRPTAEPSSRFSRAVGQFGTVRGDFGNRHFATSVSLEGKGAQETCTNYTSPPSGMRSVFPDTSTKPFSARDGTVSSFRILGKVSEGCAWNNCKEAAGREEPRDPRSPETLVVTSGTGEWDRVPLVKASGA